MFHPKYPRFGAVAASFGLVALCVAVGIGCSGTATPQAAQTTRMHVQVQWPDKSRVVPRAAQLLRVRVMANEPDYDVEAGHADIVRPEGDSPVSDQTIDAIPARIKIRVAVTAYPNADGTGTVQAVSAQDVVTGEPGATTETDLTLDSTIDHVEAVPASLTLSASGGGQITATAYDAKNNVVPTDPNGWKWTSSDSAVSVAPTGNPVTVTAGGQAGSATITGTDSDSGKTVSATVSVTAGGGVAGCKFIWQDYGDRCSDGPHGESRSLNCHTGACEEIPVK